MAFLFPCPSKKDRGTLPLCSLCPPVGPRCDVFGSVSARVVSQVSQQFKSSRLETKATSGARFPCQSICSVICTVTGMFKTVRSHDLEVFQCGCRTILTCIMSMFRSVTEHSDRFWHACSYRGRSYYFACCLASIARCFISSSLSPSIQ